MFKPQFNDGYDKSRTIFDMYKNGYLSSFSVGFLPHKWTERTLDGEVIGREFTDQELIEISSVPIPANPEAAAVLRGYGLAETDDIFEISNELEAHELVSIIEDEFRAILRQMGHEVDLRRLTIQNMPSQHDIENVVRAVLTQELGMMLFDEVRQQVRRSRGRLD